MTRLEELGAAVAEALDETLTDDGRRRAVLARLKSEERVVRISPQRTRTRVFLGAAAFAAATALLLLWPSAPSDDTLSYRVDGQDLARLDEGTIRANALPVPIRFSDSSWVELAPGAIGRIMEVTSRGAAISLDDGELTVFVNHQPSTAWSVQAGPYRVSVTGTRFRVGWEPAEEVFDLEVYEGEVVVTGPGLRRRAVRGGEQLRQGRLGQDLNPPSAGAPAATDPAPSIRARPSTRAFEPPSTPGVARSARPAPTPRSTKPGTTPKSVAPLQLRLPPKQPEEARMEAQAKPEPTPLNLSREAPPPPAWKALLARGAYDEALRTSSPAELEAAIWSATAEQLLGLAASARRQRDARAGSIYSVIRSRFPGSNEAADAAFMLGRTAFHARGFAQAATWLETYLRERPDGRFARDASGRLIEAYSALDNEISLRGAANRYLDRYPDGPHAALAQKALE